MRSHERFAACVAVPRFVVIRNRHDTHRHSIPQEWDLACPPSVLAADLSRKPGLELVHIARLVDGHGTEINVGNVVSNGWPLAWRICTAKLQLSGYLSA